MHKKAILYLLLALIWMYEITYLSLFFISDELSSSWFDFPHKDKVGHFGFYFGFVFLWNIFFKSIQLTVLKKIVFSAIIYGILMEFFQYIMPYGRMFDVKDIFANIAGAICGYFFFKSGLPLLEGLKRKN